MSDLSVLQRRYDDLERALRRAESAPRAEDRDELREAIVALFRETELALGALTGFKESIRPLVERYRGIFPAAPGSAGAPAGAAPRVDHLGASTFLERAWSAIAACRYENALGEVERAVRLAPGDAQAETLLGWALMRLGRLEEARAALERVLARDPGAALARASLGYVALREGRHDEAAEHLSRVADSTGDRKAALFASLYQGMLQTERGRFDDARRWLLRALDLGPSLIEAYWELGRSHYLEGHLELALDAWRRGVATNRFNPWADRCQAAAEQAAAGGPVRFD